MAPWIPRLHLFEIDDQPWFPPYLRARVQDGLTHVWTTRVPLLEASTPAERVANILQRVLGSSVLKYTYIDFCAGAGGPTPSIERALNSHLLQRAASDEAKEDKTRWEHNEHPNGHNDVSEKKSYAAVTANGYGPRHSQPGVNFVLTDLHPNPESWERAAQASEYITYEPEPVDASSAPPGLIAKYKRAGGRIFRSFNLAFHHFDDDLARAILKNTVETSHAFGIFELQDRSISSFVACFLFGFFVLLVAPLLYWWSPRRLFFVYVLPVIPFVLVFDGLVSSLRARTPEEVEILLRTCGANTDGWVVKSGSERFLWPIGYMNWIICAKQEAD